MLNVMQLEFSDLSSPFSLPLLFRPPLFDNHCDFPFHLILL